jgi:hypothetical protein
MSHHPTFDDREHQEPEPREPLRTMPHAYPLRPESSEAEPPAHEHHVTPTTPTPTPTPTPGAPPSHQAIAARAYARFVARGRNNGNDLDDWLQAERELRSEQTRAVAG